MVVVEQKGTICQNLPEVALERLYSLNQRLLNLGKCHLHKKLTKTISFNFSTKHKQLTVSDFANFFGEQDQIEKKQNIFPRLKLLKSKGFF